MGGPRRVRCVIDSPSIPTIAICYFSMPRLLSSAERLISTARELAHS